MDKVALLGLGIMGRGVAANLLKAGYPLTVYNRTPERAAPFAEQGARVAATPRQAAAGADVVIAVVGDDAASRALWLGDDGILAGAQPGTALIEFSTLSPDWVRELGALAAERGCSFLDAPMSGSKDAAANAQIRLWVGGDAETFARVKPVLAAVSRDQTRLGDVGAGAVWKLINNSMMAVQAAALAESLATARAAGMDMNEVEKLILGGAGASVIVQGKLPRMLAERYDDTDFALKWMEKDARYAVEMASALGLSLETVKGALMLYEQAHARGFGDADFAAVLKSFDGESQAGKA
jgi:3-hydroxyisobutyrate dehydrogenase